MFTFSATFVNITNGHKINPLIQVQLFQTALAGFVSDGSPSHIKEVVQTTKVMVVKPLEVVHKVVHISFKNTCYIALQPNNMLDCCLSPA